MVNDINIPGGINLTKDRGECEMVPISNQCQQGKCNKKARFLKRFANKEKRLFKQFRFCQIHLDTRLVGYETLDFNVIQDTE